VIKEENTRQERSSVFRSFQYEQSGCHIVMSEIPSSPAPPQESKSSSARKSFRFKRKSSPLIDGELTPILKPVLATPIETPKNEEDSWKFIDSSVVNNCLIEMRTPEEQPCLLEIRTPVRQIEIPKRKLKLKVNDYRCNPDIIDIREIR
jgi:hypothetical protein